MQDQPLFPGSKISRAESVLLTMIHSLRHSMSKEATESVLKLVEAHLPDGTHFPSTKYSFYKNFFVCSKKTRHFYCECQAYIGEIDDATDEVACSDCKKLLQVKDLKKKSSYFYMLHLEEQIRTVLEERGSVPDKPSPSYDVSDITQSAAYHNLPLQPGDLTVTFNTDGVPLYESSGFGIWPLLLQVNELAYKERTQRLLLAGLWFGPKKPIMNSFLLPFVQEMNLLSTQGVLWKDKFGAEKTSRVFPGPCTVDTVARRDVTAMMQFNGEHGCAWCAQRGESVTKGKGHCRAYSIKVPVQKRRTDDSFVKHADKARTKKKKSSRGIRGVSVLTLLSYFSFSSGFVVDYMHAVCSGFVNSTMSVWLDSERCKRFAIRDNLDEVNALLLEMTPTWEQSRLGRPLAVRANWKSSEWRNWLLFYSPVILRGYIPEPNYKNWMKFVEMMHCMLAATISAEVLGLLKTGMRKFFEEYEGLYGIESMSYNAHLLIHLVDCVSEWGPLWGYSLYPFESMNGKLGKFVSGTRYAEVQVVDKFNILYALPKLWRHVSQFKLHGYDCDKHFERLLKGYCLKKNCVHVGDVLLHGKGKLANGLLHYKKMSIGNFS